MEGKMYEVGELNELGRMYDDLIKRANELYFKAAKRIFPHPEDPKGLIDLIKNVMLRINELRQNSIDSVVKKGLTLEQNANNLLRCKKKVKVAIRIHTKFKQCVIDNQSYTPKKPVKYPRSCRIGSFQGFNIYDTFIDAPDDITIGGLKNLILDDLIKINWISHLNRSQEYKGIFLQNHNVYLDDDLLVNKIAFRFVIIEFADLRINKNKQKTIS
jgi:hypothetical protein